MSRHNLNQGFTLVEFMCAIMVSLLLMALVLKIFLSSQKVFAMQQELFQLQNDAMLVQHVLQNELHLAGNIGCSKLINGFDLVNNTSLTLTPNSIMTGTSSSITMTHLDPNNNTEIDYMSDLSHIVIGFMPKEYHESNFFFITDCRSADVFQLQRTESRHIFIPTKPLSHLYQSWAQISEISINHFYLLARDNSLNLVVENIAGRKTYLAANIQELNFKYTINQNGAYKDLNADQIVDWTQVVGVDTRIVLGLHDISQAWQFYTALR